MFLTLIPENAMTIVSLVMFLITYVCLLAFPKYRAYIALLTGVLFIVLYFTI